MREIKFRAWVNGKVEIPIFDGGRWYVDWRDYEDAREINNPVIEEYTGLKDKNGVEVYEGDVAMDDDGAAGVVEYCAPHFWVIFRDEDGKRHYSYLEVTAGSKDGMFCDQFEVIGNIHQNPELLKLGVK